MAICISQFPGSEWLLSRTELSYLKSTTLATFFTVIDRFGYGEKSYRDKTREEKHLLFDNSSKLFVIQVDEQPNQDPNFDRIGSFGYTGVFLDEAQQMANKVREVAKARLSKKKGTFQTNAPELQDATEEQLNQLCGKITFYVTKYVLSVDQEQRVEEKIEALTNKIKEMELLDQDTTSIYEQLEKEKRDIDHIRDIKSQKFHKTVEDGGRIHYIDREETLIIPYTYVKTELINGEAVHTLEWYYKGCIFSGCNPGTNFTRTDFYKPYKDNTLEFYKQFIIAKVNDNPWVDRGYIETLEQMPEDSITKQRLLYGNFDFDDNPNALFDYNTASQRFNMDYTGDRTKYMTIDASRMGKDSTEIFLWQGLLRYKKITIKIDIKKGMTEAEVKKEKDKMKIPNQVSIIEDIAISEGIDLINNTIVDEVGVGGGFVDMLGCIGFIGNSSALSPYSAKYLSWKKRNYANLRTQAFYYLQRYWSQIVVRASTEEKEIILEELLTIKEKNIVDDTKLQIIKKDEMKSEIGRSPDKADSLSMRMWWLIREHHI